MLIPSQLPQFVTAARPGALQALALQSGQMLDARIIGPAPNGGTQVEIRGQMLNLVLPTLVKAGENIRLEVQGSGPQMRLALQLAAPGASAPASSAPPAPAQQASIPLPLQASTAQLPLPSAVAPAQAQVVPQPTSMVSPPATQAAAQPQAPVAGQPTPTANPVPAPVTAPAPGQPLQGGPPAVQAAPVPASPGATPAQAAPASTPGAQLAHVASTLAPSTAPASPIATALPNPLAAAVVASVAVPAPPASAAAIPGAVRPVVPATAIGTATTHSSPGNPMPQPPPQQPATPQAALAQMVHASVPRQGSMIALTTALTEIAGKVALPEPVIRAAQQVLAGRVSIAGARFDGAALQAAIRGSGVFQEANLAQGKPQLAQTDMKSALLSLRHTLSSWLGQQAPITPVAQIPPPLRGSTPRARTSDAPPLNLNAPPEEVGRQLLERTESALARMRLHQHASLPDPIAKTADWSMDLPVMVGTQQTLMQIQIHRDQQNESEAASERGWQLRFALSLPEMGEVGAQVTLRAGQTGVMLWATEPEASAALELEVALLRDTLAGAGLRPGSVLVRHGSPPMPVSSGHFVDATS